MAKQAKSDSRRAQSGGQVEANGVTFELLPPRNSVVEQRPDDYLIVAPFARSVAEVAIGGSPARRRNWPSASALIAPPDTALRIRAAEPVEFLLVAVRAWRAEAVFDRVARGRRWNAEVIEAFADPGFPVLQQEVRRSMLGDPLAEPIYLDALADGMLARIGCRLTGSAIGQQAKEAIAPGRLRRILERIDSRLDEKLTVEELAREAGLSRSHFGRAFRAATGEAPRDFIISRRICRARDLLSESDLSLAEIALSSGFSSQGHLSNQFRKRVGVTPGRYRDAVRVRDLPDKD